MPSQPLFDQLRAASPLISVGMLTADWMSLGSELKLLETAGVRLLQYRACHGSARSGSLRHDARWDGNE